MPGLPQFNTVARQQSFHAGDGSGPVDIITPTNLTMRTAEGAARAAFDYADSGTISIHMHNLMANTSFTSEPSPLQYQIRAYSAIDYALGPLVSEHATQRNSSRLAGLDADAGASDELPAEIHLTSLGRSPLVPLLLLYRKDWWQAVTRNRTLAAQQQQAQAAGHAGGAGSAAEDVAAAAPPPPASWQALLAVAEALVDRDLDGDGVPDHVLCADLMPSCKGHAVVGALFAALAQSGGTAQGLWWDAAAAAGSMRPTIDNPAMREALRLYARLVHVNTRAFSPSLDPQAARSAAAGGAAAGDAFAALFESWGATSSSTNSPDAGPTAGDSAASASASTTGTSEEELQALLPVVSGNSLRPPLLGSCQAINPLFAAGRCLFSLDWATVVGWVLPDVAPGLVHRLGAAMTPGSEFVLPREAGSHRCSSFSQTDKGGGGSSSSSSSNSTRQASTARGRCSQGCNVAAGKAATSAAPPDPPPGLVRCTLQLCPCADIVNASDSATVVLRLGAAPDTSNTAATRGSPPLATATDDTTATPSLSPAPPSATMQESPSRRRLLQQQQQVSAPPATVRLDDGDRIGSNQQRTDPVAGLCTDLASGALRLVNRAPFVSDLFTEWVLESSTTGDVLLDRLDDLKRTMGLLVDERYSAFHKLLISPGSGIDAFAGRMQMPPPDQPPQPHAPGLPPPSSTASAPGAAGSPAAATAAAVGGYIAVEDLSELLLAARPIMTHANMAPDTIQVHGVLYRLALDQAAYAAAATGAVAGDAAVDAAAALAGVSATLQQRFQDIDQAFPYVSLRRLLYWQVIGYAAPLSATSNGGGDQHSGALRPGMLAIAVAVPLVCTAALALIGAMVLVGRRGRRCSLLSGTLLPPGPGPQSSLVVTDVQDSTALWEALPADVMDQVLSLHHETMRRVMEACEGFEVATEGDAFLVAFHSSHQAVEFCIDVQQALLHADWPEALLAHPDGCELWCRSELPDLLAQAAAAASLGGAGGRSARRSSGCSTAVAADAAAALLATRPSSVQQPSPPAAYHGEPMGAGATATAGTAAATSSAAEPVEHRSLESLPMDPASPSPAATATAGSGQPCGTRGQTRSMTTATTTAGSSCWGHTSPELSVYRAQHSLQPLVTPEGSTCYGQLAPTARSMMVGRSTVSGHGFFSSGMCSPEPWRFSAGRVDGSAAAAEEGASLRTTLCTPYESSALHSSIASPVVVPPIGGASSSRTTAHGHTDDRSNPHAGVGPAAAISAIAPAATASDGTATACPAVEMGWMGSMAGVDHSSAGTSGLLLQMRFSMSGRDAEVATTAVAGATAAVPQDCSKLSARGSWAPGSATAAAADSQYSAIGEGDGACGDIGSAPLRSRGSALGAAAGLQPIAASIAGTAASTVAVTPVLPHARGSARAAVAHRRDSGGGAPANSGSMWWGHMPPSRQISRMALSLGLALGALNGAEGGAPEALVEGRGQARWLQRCQRWLALRVVGAVGAGQHTPQQRAPTATAGASFVSCVSPASPGSQPSALHGFGSATAARASSSKQQQATTYAAATAPQRLWRDLNTLCELLAASGARRQPYSPRLEAMQPTQAAAPPHQPSSPPVAQSMAAANTRSTAMVAAPGSTSAGQQTQCGQVVCSDVLACLQALFHQAHPPLPPLRHASSTSRVSVAIGRGAGMGSVTVALGQDDGPALEVVPAADAGAADAGVEGGSAQQQQQLLLRGLRVRMGCHTGVHADEVLYHKGQANTRRPAGSVSSPRASVTAAAAAAGAHTTAASPTAAHGSRFAVGTPATGIQYCGAFLKVARETSDAAAGGVVLLSEAAFHSFQQLPARCRRPDIMLLHMGEHVLDIGPGAGDASCTVVSGVARTLFCAVGPGMGPRLALLPALLRSRREAAPGCLSAPLGAAVVPAFLYVVGSEALAHWARHLGPPAVAMVKDALETVLRVVRDAAVRYGGYVVATSSSSGAAVVVFGSAANAVEWGLDVLAALRCMDWPAALLEHDLTEEMWMDGRLVVRGPRLRIGIDHGHAGVRLVPRTGRLDYTGRPMNRAARVAAKAKAGTVVATSSAWHPAAAQLHGHVCAKSMGLVLLKGVREPLTLWVLEPRASDQLQQP